MFQVIESMEYGLKFSGVASIWDCGIPINWLFNTENDGKPEDDGVPGTLFSDKPFFQSMIHWTHPHVYRDIFCRNLLTSPRPHLSKEQLGYTSH